VGMTAQKRQGLTGLGKTRMEAGAKHPGPLDSPRSPERLKVVSGVFRSSSGAEVTLGPNQQGDSLLLSRAGQSRLALLPLDFRTFRSFDMTVVVNLKAGSLPASALTLKQGGRVDLYTRVGAAAPPWTRPPR